jgi:3-methyladenine DNA glycosylase AlkD
MPGNPKTGSTKSAAGRGAGAIASATARQLTAANVAAAVVALADPRRDLSLHGYFKTGPGQYGAGDVFVGVTVPALRSIARRYRDVPLGQIPQLLDSEIHEVRLAALLILVDAFAKGDRPQQRQIYALYGSHIDRVNQWDLVDTSAPQIVGGWLADRNRRPLYTLAKARSLWRRRIAMVATHHFIRRDDFDDALAIAELLLSAPEDLLHKAVGWTLREIGKRDRGALVGFLEQHRLRMPRTALRYAIEHFSPAERARFMARGE